MLRVEIALGPKELRKKVRRAWYKRCLDSPWPGLEHAFLILFRLMLVREMGWTKKDAMQVDMVNFQEVG